LHEVAHFFPRLPIGPREIKAASLVLFDRRTLRQDRVKLTIMAEDDPVLTRDFCKPFIICRVLGKFKVTPRVVMIFDSKRRAGLLDSFGKAFAKISIKKECQWTRDLSLPPPGIMPSNFSASLTSSFLIPKS
jgi:hypothetical protein